MKKHILVIIGMAIGASSAWAGPIFSDDFFSNGGTTGYDTTGAIVGPGWTTSVGNIGARLYGDRLRFHSSATGQRALYNTNADTGSDFTMSLDLRHLASQKWAGLAFHVQDESNFYYLRTRGNGTANVQFGKIVGGTDTLLLNSSASTPIVNGGSYYTFTAKSVGGEYSFNIEDSVGTVIFDRTYTGSDTTFTSGFAGVYAGDITSSPDIEFDNLNVVPEPATFGLMGLAGVAVLFARRRFI